jgi:pathogenesis-related protein 1
MNKALTCRWLAGFLLLLVGCAAAQIDNENSRNNRIDLKKMVEAHNSWRKSVGVSKLRWSTNLENKALAWANELKEKNGCRMKHSGPGENLFWGSAYKTATKEGNGDWQWQSQVKEISEQQVVDSWGSEVQWYSYENNSCSAPANQSCGHYTQLVWAGSNEVGCGVAVCPDDSQVWVCNYAPAGNIIGRKPY